MDDDNDDNNDNDNVDVNGNADVDGNGNVDDDDDVIFVDDVSPLNKWVTTTNNNFSQKTNFFKANPNTNNSPIHFQR